MMMLDINYSSEYSLKNYFLLLFHLLYLNVKYIEKYFLFMFKYFLLKDSLNYKNEEAHRRTKFVGQQLNSVLFNI